MAALVTSPNRTANQESDWNEAQIESALGRLQEMHAQQPSPEDLYTSFASNATAIRSNIKDFSKTFQDDSCTAIFKKAEESRAQSNEDIPGWKVTEHEDWLDIRNVDSPPNLGANGTSRSDHPDTSQKLTMESEYVRAAMERFKKGNTDIEAFLDENSGLLKVWMD
ncbi:MAG: hypothetical protein Q9225_000041 [Loekoesia sp. 1 TL-2023]